TLRGRLADGRREESLVLETSERLVDGPQSDVSTSSLQNLLADRNAVRAFADAKDREQDDLLELTEHSGSYLSDNAYHIVWLRPRQELGALRLTKLDVLDPTDDGGSSPSFVW